MIPAPRALRIASVPGALVAAAFAVIVGLYWTNDDMAGDPDALRGDGVYRPVLDRGDGHMLYLMARSTALDFDWDFANDLHWFGDPWYQPIGPTGRKQIPHPIGPALIWTPLIWTAEGLAVIANQFGAAIPLHGYTPWHQRFVFLSSALAGCLAVWLGMRVARRALAPRDGPSTTALSTTAPWATAYAAIAVVLGTPITYYATYMPSYGHALDAVACAAFLATWVASIQRWTVRRWIALGALLGVAMLIRTQNLAMGIVVAIEIGAAISIDVRRRAVDWRIHALRWLAGGAIVAAVALVVFVPQLVYWKLIYGRWIGLPQGARYTRLGSPMILELLFSARNGWLSSTPIAYLGMIGLACVPRRARLIAIGLGAAVAIQIYLNATILDWWAMSSFGQRRMCSATLPLVVGLAALIWRCGGWVGRWRRVPRAVWHAIAIAVLLPMVAWNLWRVSALSSGKAAPADLAPTCCAHVPAPLRDVARAIYDRIGNPFELPASAWFAVRHDVSLTRWDIAVGGYPMVPPANALLDDRLWDQIGELHLGYTSGEPYLIGGWSQPHESDRPFRWTTTRVVRALIPNLMPYDQAMTLWLAPAGARSVVVRWDGDEVAHVALAPGWNPIEFTRRDVAVGDHELEIEAVPGPYRGGDGWPMTTQRVGVAVNVLDLALVRPGR